MGGAKSRKGKKAWRKNIDTADVEEFIQQSAHQEQRGPAVQTLQDEDLFVIDKAPGEVPNSVLPKRARAAKPLKAQVILYGIKAVQPVHQQPPVKPKTGLPPPRQLAAAAAAAPAPAPPSKQQQRKRRAKPGVTDLWDEDGNVKADTQPSTSGRAAYSSAEATDNDWAAPLPKPSHPALKRRKGQQGLVLPKPAVEIDAAGCSFNPEHEQHQEALAELVALERKKQLRRYLAPRAPPGLVTAGGAPQDELTRLLGDVAEPQQEQQEEEQQQGRQGEEAGQEGEDGDGDGDAAGAGGAAGGRKKTRADRNKLARRRALGKEAEEKERLKRQRRQLERVGELGRELEEEAAEKEARRLRRQIVAAEKAASLPPRLGKQRYQPTAAPVLTSDQITGSLRQLPPCFTVTKERFGSLQKRGLVEPRRPATKRQGRRVAYVGGDRKEKANAGQEELVQMRQASAKMRKAAKAADAAGASAGMDIWGAA